jgi:hypothetical protein
MAILQKSWHQPFTNQFITRSGDSYDRTRSYLWHIKEALISHPTCPWTIVASSNQTISSLGDNWTSVSDVVKGTNDTWNGSWILFRTPTISFPRLWLYIDWTDTLNSQANIRVTTTQPDVSSLSPAKGLVLDGPTCGENGWIQSATISGTYSDDMSAIVASDGSFLITQGEGVNFAGDPMTISSDKYWLMFNRLQDVQSQDPYGFVLGSSGNISDSLVNEGAFPWRDFRTIHPNGSQVTCSIVRPQIPSSSQQYAFEALIDDPLRNFNPVAYPMRVVSTTSGKESYKGFLEDFWWGARLVRKFGQPGFDGASLAVMQKGLLWVPAVEPYRW